MMILLVREPDCDYCSVKVVLPGKEYDAPANGGFKRWFRYSVAAATVISECRIYIPSVVSPHGSRTKLLVLVLLFCDPFGLLSQLGVCPNGSLILRFHPTDEELIRYLLKFVSCKNYSCDNIRFEDLFGNQKPWEIFESNSSGDAEEAKKVKYFFTQLHAQLKKKKSGGTRFIRTVIGGGSWKGLDCEKSVYDGPKLVGHKKNYRYQHKGYQADDVVWTMREYSLDEKILKALRRDA
ncbi:hypothetical protein CQW23_32900 [Capsicum baccatum]|uniref:NAC domain-containing protein n=1 Tax=Capsicum baccatum TaxID=33114 RepID=A0A2G2V3D5_CAPBA|nr:hypothetical protein CQW23_32900 [Capsicum baccatum]